jgi:opacity protein-like surface antigen
LSIHRTTVSIAVLALILIATSSASAQSTAAPSTPSPAQRHTLTLTGSFGYLFAQTTGTGGDKVPAGWIVTGEGVYNSRIAAVAEFAGSYQDEHMYRTNLGGGRFIFLKDGPIRPFAQLLAGKGRSSAVGDEVSAFTLQPGAGVDFNVIPHIGIRLQGDYDWRHRDTGNVNGYRFAASIVIR